MELLNTALQSRRKNNNEKIKQFLDNHVNGRQGALRGHCSPRKISQKGFLLLFVHTLSTPAATAAIIIHTQRLEGVLADVRPRDRAEIETKRSHYGLTTTQLAGNSLSHPPLPPTHSLTVSTFNIWTGGRWRRRVPPLCPRVLSVLGCWFCCVVVSAGLLLFK